MICTHCNREINENAKFCPFCGREVTQSVALVLRCRHCNEPINLNQKFCPACGRLQRWVEFCPVCSGGDNFAYLEPGANFCAFCGSKRAVSGASRNEYNRALSDSARLSETAFKATALEEGGFGYSEGQYPLLMWNGLLITIAAGSVCVYNVKAVEGDERIARPFKFSPRNVPGMARTEVSLPKLPCEMGLERPGLETYRWPTLFKMVKGCLAVPSFERIYLWNLAANLMERQICEGGAKGWYLELDGQLCGDLATDGQRFLAALVRRGQRLDLVVFEADGTKFVHYHTWSDLGLQGEDLHLYCTEHAVYVGVQPTADEAGRISWYSLDSCRPLGHLDGYRYMHSYDNRQAVFKVSSPQDSSDLCDVMRIGPVQSQPVKILDQVNWPSTYGADGHSFWVVGRSLYFCDANGAPPCVRDLEENRMKLCLPPVRCKRGLVGVNERGQLFSIAMANKGFYKRDFQVFLDDHEIHMIYKSPLAVCGRYVYGFSSDGLVAIDMTSAPAQAQAV